MQNFFDHRGPGLDTTLPSVRHVQELIRNRTSVTVLLNGGQHLEGTIKWQDHQFIALVQDSSQPLVLLNRESIAILRALL